MFAFSEAWGTDLSVLLDWVVDVQETKMAVPAIMNEVPEEVEEEHIGGKYWQRVRELVGEDGEKRGELKGSYWTREQDELVSEDDDDNDDEDEDDSESHASDESGGKDENDNQNSNGGDSEGED